MKEGPIKRLLQRAGLGKTTGGGGGYASCWACSLGKCGAGHDTRCACCRAGHSGAR